MPFLEAEMGLSARKLLSDVTKYFYLELQCSVSGVCCTFAETF